MGISAGQLTGWVQIIKDAKVRDNMGGFDLSPVVHWEGPAHIERLKSFRGDVERMTAGAVGAHPIVRVHVRYDELTSQLLRGGNAWRLVDTDENITMNISFAQDMDGRKEMVVITAAENLPA